MSYIGKEPIVGNFQKCDAITVVNGQAAYTLQVSSTNVVPESSSHMLISLNGILQAPVTSFTVSGSTLTFASNLATGDVIDFVILLGNVLDLGTPSDATVTSAKLSGALVTPSTLDVNGNELFLDVDADTSITADTDDEIHFKGGGNDLLKLTANGLHFPQAGDGIYLGVTSETAANLLDDYEEGTWTPTWTGATAADATYTKIGRVVYASGKFTDDGSGTSGDCGGLPFSSTIDGADGGGSGYHNQDTVSWNILKISGAGFRFYTGSTQKQLTSSNQTRFFITYHV